MSTHTIQTEIEVADRNDVAYPVLELTYDYSRGHTPRIPPGEYAPIDPPESAGIEFREAKLIMADGVNLDLAQVQKLAEEWLLGPGRDYAVDAAETDLRAMHSLHQEYYRRDQ